MKRTILALALLGIALLIALVLRVRALRAGSHGPAGGTGVLEGVDVSVTSRLATRILKVNVREGDTVKQGTVVVELDCTESEARLEQARWQLRADEAALGAAQASASSAQRNASAASESTRAARAQTDVLKAQEELARAELARTEQLVKTGALAEASLDQARSRHLALLSQIAAQRSLEGMFNNQAGALSSGGRGAKAQALAAQSAVNRSQAGVTLAETAVRECKLIAPRDGLVASRYFEPGEAVQPGTALLTITDLSEARTRFYLPNEDLAAAAPGRPAKVVADAYPGRSFAGTIFYVSPKAEFTPRNVQTREDRQRLVYAVEVRIPNNDLVLRSGMPVEVSIEGSSR